jgi:hypothetical protein
MLNCHKTAQQQLTRKLNINSNSLKVTHWRRRKQGHFHVEKLIADRPLAQGDTKLHLQGNCQFKTMEWLKFCIDWLSRNTAYSCSLPMVTNRIFFKILLAREIRSEAYCQRGENELGS